MDTYCEEHCQSPTPRVFCLENFSLNYSSSGYTGRKNVVRHLLGNDDIQRAFEVKYLQRHTRDSARDHKVKDSRILEMCRLKKLVEDADNADNGDYNDEDSLRELESKIETDENNLEKWEDELNKMLEENEIQGSSSKKRRRIGSGVDSGRGTKKSRSIDTGDGGGSEEGNHGVSTRKRRRSDDSDSEKDTSAKMSRSSKGSSGHGGSSSSSDR
jgi:hypothetical protein